MATRLPFKRVPGRGATVEDGTATGRREPLTPALVRHLLEHIRALSAADLEGFTYQTRPSDYWSARDEFTVYDRTGRAVIRGRSFHRGPTAFWWNV